MLHKTDYASSFGPLTIVADEENLVGLWLPPRYHQPDPLIAEATPNDQLPLFDDVRDWLDRYFAGKAPEARELPLAPRGSEFRRAVWDALCDIPYGQTVTYGDIAKRWLPKKMAAQAVGGAVGANPISIIIPCHRVMGTGGNLTGYGGGIDNKIALLKLEGIDVSGFTIPKHCRFCGNCLPEQ